MFLFITNHDRKLKSLLMRKVMNGLMMGVNGTKMEDSGRKLENILRLTREMELILKKTILFQVLTTPD